MQIYIRTHTGKVIPMHVQKTDTWLQIKQQIAEKEGISMDAQLILIRGKEVHDQSTLADARVEYEGPIYLGIRQAIQEVKLLDNIQLLWTVNYFQDGEDNTIPTAVQSLTGHTDFATAYESFLKRSSHEAPGQKTYLALTAVHRSDLEKLYALPASDEYQAGSSKAIQIYLNLKDKPFPIMTLATAYNTENGIMLGQNSHRGVHSSRKYQEILREYLNSVNQAQSVVVQPSSSSSAPSYPAATFAIAESYIDVEIGFEGDEALIVQELNLLLTAMAEARALPVPTGAGAALHNVLLAYVNAGRRVVDAGVSNAVYLQHMTNYVRQTLISMTQAPPVTDASAPQTEGRRQELLAEFDSLQNRQVSFDDYLANQARLSGFDSVASFSSLISTAEMAQMRRQYLESQNSFAVSAAQLPSQNMFAPAVAGPSAPTCSYDYDGLSGAEKAYVSKLAHEASQHYGVDITPFQFWTMNEQSKKEEILGNFAAESAGGSFQFS